LFGDPNFGCNLKQVFFSQNNSALQFIVKEEISREISTFLPYLRVPMDQMSFTVKNNSLYMTIKVVNILTYETSIYDIELL